MKTIKTVGVVGAGTMGSALAQKFAQEGFQVILADRELAFVTRGLDRISEMYEDAIEKNVISSKQATLFLSNITGTEVLSDLGSCDLVVEAIFENFGAKTTLFEELSKVLPADTLVATNTSSFSVTELSSAVKNPERFIGLHYFYHAAKNRLVEIIPGKETSDETLRAAWRFSVLSGKDPIFTKDSYGFAINRFFVPWLNEAIKLLQEGTATMEQIDFTCMKTFGIGMGPFALMNATGVPVALHAQKTLEVLGPSYKVASLLEKQVEQKQNWPLGAIPEMVDRQLERRISERMLGSVFFVCSQILETKICSPIDLNKGARIGLKWKKGPLDLMIRLGEEEVRRLVQDYCSLYGEDLPAISAASWKMEYVKLDRKGAIASIVIDRPEDMNALNETIIQMLGEKFSIAENDPRVNTIYITGMGKAFVAGADIGFFVNNMKTHSLEKIVEFTRTGQRVFEAIDNSKKKIIALVNGICFGGGLELALCADLILAAPKAMLAFPETGIGIYPGLGGTQRAARRVGKGLAKFLILTGKTLSAAEAEECGLVDAVISPETLFALLDGEMDPPLPVKKELPLKWRSLAEFYSRNNYRDIIAGTCSKLGLEEQEAVRLGKTMSGKAPLAMRIADELIEQGRGPASELEKLDTVFNSGDALLGLTSIGKKVEFHGN